MKRAIPAALFLAALTLVSCGDENPLTENESLTGLWRSQGAEGVSYVFEMSETAGGLEGNLYVGQATGDLLGPIPMLDTYLAGNRIAFTYDFEGETLGDVPVDTISYSGTRTTANVMRMVVTVCAGDTCLTSPFDAVRDPSGF